MTITPNWARPSVGTKGSEGVGGTAGTEGTAGAGGADGGAGAEAEQLTLADMPAKLFVCTPSRLAAFACPRRYRFTYLDAPPPPRGAPWARSTVGAVVHLALQMWWRLPRAHRTPEEGARLVEQNWHSAGFRDATQSLNASVVAAGWVERYLADGAARGVNRLEDPIGVERTVATRTQRLAVSGRVDRIDDREQELVVVDYKTGSHTPTEHDARDSLALALYALGVGRTLRRPCRRVELHHLPSDSIATFDHTEESLRAHVARAEQTAGAIESATRSFAAGAGLDVAFPPAPSPGCSWCDFRSRCPEGSAASSRRDPWDGLASEPLPA